MLLMQVFIWLWRTGNTWISFDHTFFNHWWIWSRGIYLTLIKIIFRTCVNIFRFGLIRYWIRIKSTPCVISSISSIFAGVLYKIARSYTAGLAALYYQHALFIVEWVLRVGSGRILRLVNLFIINLGVFWGQDDLSFILIFSEFS